MATKRPKRLLYKKRLERVLKALPELRGLSGRPPTREELIRHLRDRHHPALGIRMVEQAYSSKPSLDPLAMHALSPAEVRVRLRTIAGKRKALAVAGGRSSETRLKTWTADDRKARGRLLRDGLSEWKLKLTEAEARDLVETRREAKTKVWRKAGAKKRAAEGERLKAAYQSWLANPDNSQILSKAQQDYWKATAPQTRRAKREQLKNGFDAWKDGLTKKEWAAWVQKFRTNYETWNGKLSAAEKQSINQRIAASLRRYNERIRVGREELAMSQGLMPAREWQKGRIIFSGGRMPDIAATAATPLDDIVAAEERDALSNAIGNLEPIEALAVMGAHSAKTGGGQPNMTRRLGYLAKQNKMPAGAFRSAYRTGMEKLRAHREIKGLMAVR